MAMMMPAVRTWLALALLAWTAVAPVRGQGASWSHADTGIPALAGITAMAVAPANPRLMVAATNEPGGLYRSTDAGDTWVRADRGLEATAIYTVALDPTAAAVAAGGTADGLYLAQDSAGPWTRAAGLPQTFVWALAFGPDGRELFAGTEAGLYACPNSGPCTAENFEGRPVLAVAAGAGGRIYSGTAGQGLWIKQSGRWAPAPAPLDDGTVTALQVGPDGTVYALRDHRLYRAGPSGAGAVMLVAGAANALALAPATPGRIYLGRAGAGLAVSEDAGLSWRAPWPDLDNTDITAVLVAAGGMIFAGTLYEGLYRLPQAGGPAMLVHGLGRPVVTSLVRDPRHPQVYYAGALDGVYRSNDGGRHWQLSTGANGRLYVHALLVRPACTDDPEALPMLYAGTRDGVYVSQDGGGAWRRATENLGGITIFNMAGEPRDPCVVYGGTWGNDVLRTEDGGHTWSLIHHGLETLSVHAVAVDPRQGNTLYAGTVEGLYKSTDRGGSWQPVNGGLLDGETIFALLPGRNGSLLAGTTAGVFASEDGGKTWRARGLEGATITTLVRDALDAQTIYAGTEHAGLYRSLDGGRTWAAWGDELASLSVYGIYAGRSALWVATDAGILRLANP